MKRFRRGRASHTSEAMATVTSCHYEFGAVQALAFGVPRTRHFEVTFNYWANGELHTGEFASDKAVPQGTLFPISYNPDAPHENSKSRAESEAPRPLVMFLAGVVILAAASAFALHSCAPIR